QPPKLNEIRATENRSLPDEERLRRQEVDPVLEIPTNCVGGLVVWTRLLNGKLSLAPEAAVTVREGKNSLPCWFGLGKAQEEVRFINKGSVGSCRTDKSPIQQNRHWFMKPMVRHKATVDHYHLTSLCRGSPGEVEQFFVQG